MTSPRIPWQRESPDGAPLNVVRHCMRPGGRDLGLHRHGFVEVCWCEAGAATHVVNGAELPLRPGDVCCIRADDAHGFRIAPAGLTLVNVSFLPASVAVLARRAGARWPWSDGKLPLQRSLGPQAMERLQAWAADLAQPGTGQIELDAFLLDLVRLLGIPQGEDGVPAWLRDASTAFADPLHLPGGPAALARLCGKTLAHLNRQVRRRHGCTASELVARLRLDWAARELRLSDRPITAIADACGMPHLGHFYRRFRGRFGTTPRRYRLDAWRVFRR